MGRAKDVSRHGVNETSVVAQLRGVCVEYARPQEDPICVVDAVNLEVMNREFLVIVGKSGCGKTTILNLLAGLVEPSRGEVSVLNGSAVKARSQLAYMFARDALLPWRTALRNVTYGLELRGVDRKKREEIATDLLARVGLGLAGKKYPSQLSQGMRQRVALARTWALQPALLLMDEPFAALDAQTRAEVQSEFLRMWEERRSAVVFVTHDLGEAIALADRILVMDDGRIIQEFKVAAPRPRDVSEISLTAWYQDMYRQLRVLIGAKGHAEESAQ